MVSVLFLISADCVHQDGEGCGSWTEGEPAGDPAAPCPQLTSSPSSPSSHDHTHRGRALMVHGLSVCSAQEIAASQ